MGQLSDESERNSPLFIVVAVGLQGADQILSCSTYDGDEEATMGSEVTHIVAEAEHAVHAAVGVATSLVLATGTQLLFVSFLFL